jgi:N-acetylmuramoyl-L-alanine amidase
MRSCPSPNFEPRRDGMSPSLVILHGTWTKDSDQSLAFLTDPDPNRPGGRVSAHYFIDTDGCVYRIVEESMRAWHAGASQWRGIADVNSASIGIELQNDGQAAYTMAQIEALIPLLRDITTRHGISPENILAHSDVAPARKDDPGPHFPWRELAEAGIGVWPNDDNADAIGDLRAGLLEWGYDPGLPTDILAQAFDLHFVPEGLSHLRARRLAALLAKSV